MPMTTKFRSGPCVVTGYERCVLNFLALGERRCSSMGKEVGQWMSPTTSVDLFLLLFWRPKITYPWAGLWPCIPWSRLAVTLLLARKMITIAAAHHYRNQEGLGKTERSSMLSSQTSSTFNRTSTFLHPLRQPCLSGKPSGTATFATSSSLETRHAATTTFVERCIALLSRVDGEQWATACVGW